MCGRYAMYTHPTRVRDFFNIRGPLPNFEARYNIAPTQTAPVIVQRSEGRQLELKSWGLVPAWSKDGKSAYATFNARAETLREKPTFRDAFHKRRCVVPADGFYEWTGAKGDKTPHFFQRADGGLLALAGLHETWQGKGGETVHSFTIAVTAANRWMSAYHDRMPVILADADLDAWLGGPPEAAAALMTAPPEDALSERVVAKAVGNVRNEGPELLA